MPSRERSGGCGQQLVLPADGAGLVGVGGDGDAEGLFGEDVLDVLRPFHYAEAAAVDVVIEADVKGLLGAVEPVEVEVVHHLAAGGAVFVHDREGRGADGVFFDTELMADGGGEGRLPGTHGREEGDQLVVADFLEELPGGPVKVTEVFYGDGMLHFNRML